MRKTVVNVFPQTNRRKSLFQSIDQQFNGCFKKLYSSRIVHQQGWRCSNRHLNFDSWRYASNVVVLVFFLMAQQHKNQPPVSHSAPASRLAQRQRSVPSAVPAEQLDNQATELPLQSRAQAITVVDAPQPTRQILRCRWLYRRPLAFNIIRRFLGRLSWPHS